MTLPTYQKLLDARVHFGHLTSKWHPSFAPFVFTKKNGVHIINLAETNRCLAQAIEKMQELVASGKKILFVGTKAQAKKPVLELAKTLEAPYITERWTGGILTNFSTIRNSLKKLSKMDVFMHEPAYQHLTKKEQASLMGRKEKQERVLAGMKDVNRPPAALFVIDINKERTAVHEANTLGIPIIALVDSNANPNIVDFPIPCNDDARVAITLILETIKAALSPAFTTWKQEVANRVSVAQPKTTTRTLIREGKEPTQETAQATK